MKKQDENDVMCVIRTIENLAIKLGLAEETLGVAIPSIFIFLLAAIVVGLGIITVLSVLPGIIIIIVAGLTGIMTIGGMVITLAEKQIIKSPYDLLLLIFSPIIVPILAISNIARKLFGGIRVIFKKII